MKICENFLKLPEYRLEEDFLSFFFFEILHVYYIPLCLGKYYFPKFIGKQEICLLLLKKTSFFFILCLLYLPKFKIFPKFKGKQEIFQIQKFFIDSSH